jgi:nickel-type superoxide dismutase maturation protease
MFLLRRVVGDSMLPGLPADRLVVAVRTRRPREGQVVFVRHDGREKMKRVQKVSDGQVFLLGDNPDKSTDSRHFGWLPTEVVFARVVWPRQTREVRLELDAE